MSKSIEELLADPETAPAITSYTDSRVTRALATNQMKRPDTSTLMQRLQRLENATKEIVRKNDLRFHVYKKATEAGISYDLIKDFPFVSPEEADKKIAAFATFAKEKASQDLNSQILNSAFRPGAGNPKDTSIPKAAKSFDDYVAEELADSK